MKKPFTSILLLGAVGLTPSIAQTLIYENDFEGDNSGLTITGSGAFENSNDVNHGTVYHNNPGLSTSARSNYLQLPSTLFSDAQSAINTAQGLTISFWVNDNGVGVDADGFWWSSMFSAYGSAPNPNNGKPFFQLNTNKRLNVNFDMVNSDGNNYGWFDNIDWGADALGVTWLDNGGWHFYTIVINPTSSKVYIDGVLSSTKTANSTNGTRVDGLFNVIGDLKYVTLGGNSGWDWNDKDTPFSYDKLKFYSGELNTTQISSLMLYDQLSAPIVSLSSNSLVLEKSASSKNITLSSANLSQDVKLTSIAGVTISGNNVVAGENGLYTIALANAAENVITLSWDTNTIITNGQITIESGTASAVLTISSDNYVPFFAIKTNLIPTPSFASLAGFGGWGFYALTSNPDEIYSGFSLKTAATSTSWPNGFSLTRDLNYVQGTTYRVRFMYKTTDGNFQINPGDMGNIEVPEAADWTQFDTSFTATTTQTKFFSLNNDGKTGKVVFIDNLEVYEVDNNSSLSALTSSIGTLSPEFSSSTLVYSILVAPSTTSITLEGVAISQGSVIVGAGDIVLADSDTTTTNIVVTAESGMQTTYQVLIVKDASLVTGTNNVISTNNVYVAQNREIVIETNESIQNGASLSLYSVSGQLIHSQALSSSIITLPMQNKGVYIVRIQNLNTSIYKVTVQ